MRRPQYRVYAQRTSTASAKYSKNHRTLNYRIFAIIANLPPRYPIARLNLCRNDVCAQSAPDFDPTPDTAPSAAAHCRPATPKTT